MKRRMMTDGEGGIAEDGITSLKVTGMARIPLFIDYLPRKLLYLILQSPFLQEVP